MKILSPIRWLRTQILLLLGIKTKQSKTADWWEVDLIIVIVLGAWVLAIASWLAR